MMIYGAILGVLGIIGIVGIYHVTAYMYKNGLQGKVKGKASPYLVREAVETLPGGLCIAWSDGFPVLTNHRMNDAVSRLFGHTVVNAEETWKEILSGEVSGECLRLSEEATFKMPEGIIVRFRRERLAADEPGNELIQITMDNVTRLTRSREETEEENRHLAEQIRRQQGILQNVVEINNEQEILSMKMKIHDEFGRCLLLTRQFQEKYRESPLTGTRFRINQRTPGGKMEMAEISRREAQKDLYSVVHQWQSVIRNMQDVPELSKERKDNAGAELDRVAALIGCKIEYDGAPPKEEIASQLFYAAVREALTNAVRHAGADVLYVRTKKEEFGPGGQSIYRILLSDNAIEQGKMGRADELTMGDGLRNLRDKLEKNGASIRLYAEDGVKIELAIPG